MRVASRHVQTLRAAAAALAAAAAGQAADPPADAPPGHWRAGEWRELTLDGLPFRLELNFVSTSRVNHTTYEVTDDGSVRRVDEEPPDHPLVTG
jgi:alkylhydroperoxidase family enzyme